jgi:hypothetical protein
MIIKTKKNGKEVYYCSIDSLLHRETSIIGFLSLPSPTCDPTTAKDLRRTRAKAFQYSSSGLSQQQELHSFSHSRTSIKKVKHILPSNTSPLSASLLPSSNYNSMLSTMARSLLISQTPVSRFLQHEYQDCNSFGRRRTTRFFFTKLAATSERASDIPSLAKYLILSRKKERKAFGTYPKESASDDVRQQQRY